MAVGFGVAVGETPGLGVGVAVGVTEGIGVIVGDTAGEGDTVGVGLGSELPKLVLPSVLLGTVKF